MNSKKVAVFLVVLVHFLMDKVTAGYFTQEGIKTQLEKYRVVPEVVDKAPEEEIEVEYPGDVIIQMGNFVTLNRVMRQPEVTWKANPTFYYLLALVDADFVNTMDSRKAEYQQWMVVNIPGNNVADGELLTKYTSPKPSNAHAYHRYVFILWRHPFVHFRVPRVREGQLPIYRENFNTKNFTAKYEANELGEPYAINFFRVCTPNKDE